MAQNAVLVLKLANGDEIVGQHVSSTDDTFSIKRPLRVAIVRDPATGQPGKALMEWIMLIPEAEVVSIYKSQLQAVPMTAPKDLADTWLEQTSGLILATGQLNG